MLTEPRFDLQLSNLVVFLFAHQDDEFGVLHQIEQEVKFGASVYCVYTTTGVVSGANPKQRNRESIEVLESLGVDSKRILFQGEILNIPDGQALDNVVALRTWLVNWIQNHQSIRTLYVPAWEGGHPDHDILHAVAVKVMKNDLSRTVIWQYPLYNSYGLKWGFFKVLKPLAVNGKVLRQVIPWPVRWRHLRLCLNYRSQVKSWLGLYPCVLWHYLFNGKQHLQQASPNRLSERPHSGQLYYEFRGFCEWEKIFSQIQQELY
jgi:LmbE family N-acetylglucosaminyl deacetylase